MSINLKELSKRLGLSPTTVSRAIAGYSDVSPITRERVQRMAKDLGYQPNRAARQIARGSADTVGIVYPLSEDYIGNPAFREMLSAVAMRLDQADIDLVLAAAPPRDEMRIYDRMIGGRRVDAMIVAHTRVDDIRVDYLLRSQMPFVAYGRTSNAEGYPWFDFDNEAGGRLAAEGLLALGHQRFAYVHSPLRLNFAYQRHAGFVAGLLHAGLVPQSQYVGGQGRRGGYDAGMRLLNEQPRPTAVVIDSTLGGIGVIRALLDRGVAIGREMSVLVYEGVPDDTLLRGVTVASIQQPTDTASGQTIGDMVMALIQRQPLAEPRVLRQPVFVAGDSIAAPPR